MLLDISKEKEFTYILLKESRLDIHLASDFSNHILQIVEHGDIQILIDLSQVEFVDSSGIGALMAAHKAIDKVDGRLVLCSLQEKVLSIFKTTLMDKVFEIQENALPLLVK